MTSLTRRTALALALATTTTLALPTSVLAQDLPTLRLSSVVSDNDIRAEAFAEIAEAVSTRSTCRFSTARPWSRRAPR